MTSVKIKPSGDKTGVASQIDLAKFVLHIKVGNIECVSWVTGVQYFMMDSPNFQDYINKVPKMGVQNEISIKPMYLF